MNFIVNNRNYSASIQPLERFIDLDNCDNVKHAVILNKKVIVSKEAKAGALGIFFPVESQLSKEFLGANNQFRKPEHGNTDQTKKGFFEEHGRVRAVKFRGHKSEGFWIPIESLTYTGLDLSIFNVGDEFEDIEHNGTTYPICKKYVPKRNIGHGNTNKVAKPKQEDRIVRNQFRLHYDTENLRRNIHKINPDDIISISTKYHGTSAVISNLLVNRELKWYEKILKRLGVKIQDQHYGIVWSSRKVIKGVEEPKESSNHFYDSDIWGVVAKEIGPSIPKSYTIYGEIVGYTPTGAAIQFRTDGDYHYGCKPGEHKFLVYRVTTTNPDGAVVELSWPQMKKFCKNEGFTMVEQKYYGSAYDHYLMLTQLMEREYLCDNDPQWHEHFLELLELEYTPDVMCPLNDFKVPAEGVVLRRDHLESSEAWKLKSFLFTAGETKALDAGTVDIETEQSEGVTDETNGPQ